MTKNQFSRRDFFKLGAVGAAGARCCRPGGMRPGRRQGRGRIRCRRCRRCERRRCRQHQRRRHQAGDTLPKWSFMVPPAPIPEDEITETIENDIIVVGAGHVRPHHGGGRRPEQGGEGDAVLRFQQPPSSRGGSNFARNSKVMEELKVEPFRAQPLLLP